jgi:hypothetical protein
MKTFKFLTALVALILPANGIEAATFYVNAGNPAPASPFTT